METTEEEYLTDMYETAERTELKETRSILPDDYVKEFEEYLMEIGLRF